MNTYQERPRKDGGMECLLASTEDSERVDYWRRLLPIAFTAADAQKVHDGSKTQMRKLEGWWTTGVHTGHTFKAKYRVGDVLWVQEPWRTHQFQDNRKPSGLPENVAIKYEGQPTHDLLASDAGKLRHAVTLPLRFARPARYEVTGVRLERVNEISEADAECEGITAHVMSFYGGKRIFEQFQGRWDSTHSQPGTRFKDAPWVFAYTFRRVR